MNFKKYHVSKNLFDKGLLVDAKGLFLDGRVVDDPNRTSTVNAISVSDSSYALSWASDDVLAITATYNNGTLVNRVASLVSPTVIDTTGANELRVTFYKMNVQITKNDVSNIMFNTGSQPLPYEPYSSEVWHDIPYYQHKTATDTLTLPAVIYPNDTSITVGIKGQSSQNGTGTTSYPSKSVTVQSLESGTNYAKFNLADFSDVAVNDKITVNVGGTNYSLAVKKIDSSYVYVENKEV